MFRIIHCGFSGNPPFTGLTFSNYQRYHSNHARYDVAVVGGGIIGCSTALQLLWRYPNLQVALLEKENRTAMHQSGRNSGVIHMGIYYTPGSLKAKLCTEGADLAYQYFDKHSIPYKKCGKIIVATNEKEVKLLNKLYERGLANNVKGLSMIDGDAIREREPNCRGLKAIDSPNTGIVDWQLVTRSFAKEFESLGGTIILNSMVTGMRTKSESLPGEVDGLDYPVVVESDSGGTINSKFVVVCGGLQSDRLAALSGCSVDPKIVPFRGDYLELVPESRDLVRGNIYPVNDPDLPFLGVHFTPRMDGAVWVGPNAVLSLAREGYGRAAINASDAVDALTSRGLRRLAFRHLGYGVSEFYRSLRIGSQLRAVRRLVPSVTAADLTRGPSGIRAQALYVDGNLVDDFVFDSGSGPLASRTLHVRNAPSPAATSSLAIAKLVVDKAATQFHL